MMRLLRWSALVITAITALAVLSPSVSAQLNRVSPAQIICAAGGIIVGGSPTTCSASPVITGPLLVADGAVGAPSYSFSSDTDTGLYYSGGVPAFAFGGAIQQYWNSGGVVVRTLMLDTSNSDVVLSRETTATLQLGADAAGVTDQTFKGPDRITSDGVGGNLIIAGGRNRGASAGGSILFQTSPSAGAGVAGTLATNLTIDSTGAVLPRVAQITAGAATGLTVNNTGAVQDVIYKVTIDRTAFVAAAVTADVTVATLPAKTQIIGVMADLTTQFACTATCTSSTLSMVFGRGSGGAQWLASFDADAATAQFGDADAELGTTMTRAAAIQGGSFEAWGSTQAAVLRLTSGTGNIGNGSATNLSQGSVTLYIHTRIFP